MNPTTQQPVTHFVTLYVDTENVSQGNLNDTCHFEVNQETLDAPTLEKFLIEVDPGDEVIWEGIANNGEDEVNIEVILYSGGIPAFGKNVNVIKSGPNPGTISCRMRNYQNKGGVCKYSLIFSVSNKMGTFIIDPDIRVK